MLRGVDVLNIEMLAHRPTHAAAATLHVFLSLFMTKKRKQWTLSLLCAVWNGCVCCHVFLRHSASYQVQ